MWRALPRDLFLARPGSGVVYAVVFGLVGRHPLIALLIDVALVAIVALLLHRVFARFLPRRCPDAAAVLWVVLANHGSLLHWATAAAITVALALLLFGVLLLDDGRVVAAAVVLGASVLCYEATGPAAAAVVVAVPLLRRRPWRRPLLVGATVLVPVAVWMLVNLPSVKDGLDQQADLGLLLPAHVGWGVLPDGAIATFGGAAALLATALVVVEAVRSRRWTVEAATLAAGAATILLGTMPFLRYYYSPLGAGDRVHVVAGVGTALLWTAIGAWTARHLPIAAFTPMAAAVVLAMVFVAWQGSMSWADAADDAGRVMASLPHLEPGDAVTIERPRVRRNVAAFADRSNILSAVQLEADTRDVVAGFTPGR
ncbi:MAG TPA: hypothetical protein VM143_11375 [Acidimicrobiales bacterium]|nr:hypothetical protein [Acidimicrobiales bacterium]